MFVREDEQARTGHSPQIKTAMLPKATPVTETRILLTNADGSTTAPAEAISTDAQDVARVRELAQVRPDLTTEAEADMPPLSEEDVSAITAEVPVVEVSNDIDSAVPGDSLPATDVAAPQTAIIDMSPLPTATSIDAIAAQSPLSDNQWDPQELEMLAAPSYETVDVLATLPVGAVVKPPIPLTIDELLSADQKEIPVGYTEPVPGMIGTPFQLNTGNAPAQAGWGVLPAGQMQIDSTDFLDYDEEHNMLYGHGRVTVRYGMYKLTADRVMVDTRLREVQAYGNVILASPAQHIEAQSMWVDAENYQGVAYESVGHSGDFYMLSEDPHCDHGTTIRQVSQSETVFEDSSFTTCDFPVPHYRLKAKEFTIMQSERIFARNVILYVREKPILWLPFFTRALQDKNPWGFSAGSDSRLGVFARLFYDFHQHCYTPSDVDDRIMLKSSDSHARVRLDYFSKRGFGQGLDYSYFLNNGKHRGELFAYRINDRDRDVSGDDNTERTYIDFWNRTRLTEELDWVTNVDWASDPEIFYDILDRVRSSGDWERGRLPERVAQTGLEWTADDFYAGIQVEIKDRIGRDRVSNFAEFRDGDFDFDRRFNDEDFFTLSSPGYGPDGAYYPYAGRYLDSSSVAGSLDEGIASGRYGRVSERLPHLRVSTNRMRLWTLPLWYHMDVNVFNNLDKGLNVVGTEDDSFVRGFDLYQSVSHLMKFCDRYTWLTKFGVGVGVADRADDSYNLDFPSGATFPYVYDGQLIDGHPLGLTFTDEDTFLVGQRRMSLSQVDPAFVYGDIDSRFNARVSECMTAFVRYRLREGTDNNLGTFYESIGARKAMDDLYAFRTPEHWIEGGLTYNFIDPQLSLSFNLGQNLQGNDEITPGELRNYSNLGVSYSNLRNTVLLNAGVGHQTRQLRDPTDPFAFDQRSFTYYVAGSYLPVHQRHWGRLGLYFIQNLEDDPLMSGTVNDRRNFDTRNEALVDGRIGKKVGQKYLVELRSRIRSRTDDNQDTYVRIERDFHDLVAGVSLGVRSRRRLSDEREDATEDSFQVRFEARFKPASQKGVVPVVTSTKLYDSGRSGFIAREEKSFF